MADLVILRFFVGDAVAFAYALQQIRITGPSSSSHWYRDRYHFEPLVLDDEHYSDASAPLVFDIIDTSNLIDHLGALNLLTATSPLLRNSLSATLYSEKLVRTQETQISLLETLSWETCLRLPRFSAWCPWRWRQTPPSRLQEMKLYVRIRQAPRPTSVLENCMEETIESG